MRVEHACQWALRKRWVGINAQERAMLAACIIANAGRTGAVRPELERLASPDHLWLAEIWGLAIRLCRRLSGASAPVLAGSALAIKGERLVLTVQKPYAALYTEPVQKDLNALADKLGLQADFRPS